MPTATAGVPTAIWHLLLRSRSARRDLALAVEVQECPLRSGVAVGKEITEEEEERRRDPLQKSSNLT